MHNAPSVKRISIFIYLILILGTGYPALAQSSAPVQELSGRIESGRFIYYLLPDLKRGDTLYVHMQGTSGNLDPVIGLQDAVADQRAFAQAYQAELEAAIAAGDDPLLATRQTRDQTLLAWDDDSGGGLAAALQYTIPGDGDYRLIVGGEISQEAVGSFGGYRLLLGLNAPEVLSGTATPTGDEIAIYDTDANPERTAINQASGELGPDKTSTFLYIHPLRAGDTLYAYVKTSAGNLKPVLVLRNFAGKPLRMANLDGEMDWASMEYTLPSEAEKYRIQILANESGGEMTSGSYQLWVGLNAPQVLQGNPVLTTDQVISQPIEVQVGIKLQQIINVNQADENMNVVATMQMEWVDPALAYRPDTCNCSVKIYTEKEFERFLADAQGRWPDFTFANQQGNRWVQNRIVVLYPNGSATYFERFSTNLQLDFDFRRYPFDVQQFLIRVDMLNPEELYQFTDLPGYSEISQEHGEDEFIITGFDTQISRLQSSTQSVTSRFTFQFEAPRHLDYYILQIFVPILLIVGVSWITFFLKDYTRRIEVSAGNLLLFIAYSFSISANYPRLGYLTFMDVMMANTFIVTALVVAYNVWLRRMEMADQIDKAERIDAYLDWLYPFFYIVPIALTLIFYF